MERETLGRGRALRGSFAARVTLILWLAFDRERVLLGRMSAARLIRELVLIGVVSSLLVYAPSEQQASANSAVGEEASGALRVVGKLPLFEPGRASAALIVNPATRRGYQVFSGETETVLRSFDLDTLEPLRRAVISNFVVLQVGNPTFQGDVVHAVDEAAGRLFLAGLTQGIPREMVVAVIGEKRLDEGTSSSGTVPEAAFVTRRLSVPISQRTQILTTFQRFSFSPSVGGTLRGMAFSGASGAPKLLLLFGSVDSQEPVQNHYLAQWDPDRMGEGIGDWIVRLAACERNHLVNFQSWRYQLEILRGTTEISVGCKGTSNAQVVVFPLIDSKGSPDPAGIPSENIYEVVQLPRQLSNVLADPESERLLVEVTYGGSTWWAFDARARAWVGAAGQGGLAANALDPSSGRFYSLITDSVKQGSGGGLEPVQGGFLFTDPRLTPIPQFTNAIPELAYPGQFRGSVDPEAPGRTRKVFVRRGNSALATTYTYPGTTADTPAPVEDFYYVIEDTVPLPSEPSLSDLDMNTTDVEEEDGISGTKFDIFGSGFGFRSLLVGGIAPAISRELAFALPAACYKADRETIMGGVESARLSNLNASAASLSLSADEGTEADLESPASRCWPGTLNQNLPTSTAQAADDVARQPWDSNGDGKDDFTAECSGDDGKVESPTPPKHEGAYSSWAECDHSGGLVRGSSSGRVSPGGGAAPVSVLSASSIVTAKKAEGGGTIVEADSIARGIEIAGVGTIGLVRAVAVARSAGRPETAYATFDRFICSVDIPGFKIASCLTEAQQKQFIDGLNQLLARMEGKARLRQPDSALYPHGTPGGYIAAVQRNTNEALDDKLVSRDHSETVPGLEIIFYRGDSQLEGSGRQIFQLAAVQASSAYGIFCLFGEAESGQCVRPTAELSLTLTDNSDPPEPLEGGVFEVHLDKDGDGVLGLDDPVVELTDKTAVCRTGEDGVGDCTFQLGPGDYIVHEATPPPGYASASDCVVSLSAWISQTCGFVNLKAIGTIDLLLTDDSEVPLPGGVFEIYADNGDEVLGASDLKVATCTTSAQGECVFDPKGVAEGNEIVTLPLGNGPQLDTGVNDLSGAENNAIGTDSGEGGETQTAREALQVPLGSYIVHQKSTLPDYEAASDVSFTLANPGDAAHLTLTNGLKPVEGTPEVPATPVSLSGPSGDTVFIEQIGGSPAPTVSSKPIPEPIAPSVVDRILKGPSEALKFLARNPKEAILFGGMWLILIGPIWMAWRRRSLFPLGGSL